MSKKLIAVAAAAALALTGLVGVAPANASSFAVEATGNSTESPNTLGTTDGVLATTALGVYVPSADVLRFVADNTGLGTAIKLKVTTTTARAEVTVTTTGGVKVLTEEQFDLGTATTATGTASASDFSASSEAYFYVYTTSTANGTVTVSSAGNAKTINIKGLSTWAYKLNFTAPATAALGGDIEVVGTAKDMFGNDLTTALAVDAFTADTKPFVLSAVGATAPTSGTYTAATKSYKFVFTAPKTAQPIAVQVALQPHAVSTKVTAYGDPVSASFFAVNAVNLAAQVTALTAQVAALQAIVDRKVSKKRFNTLARKWNRAFPSQKVALKK